MIKATTLPLQPRGSGKSFFLITNLFIGGPCLSCRETRSLCSFLWINYFSLNLPATALEGKHFQRRKVTTACLMKGSTGILIPRYEYGL